MHFFTHQEGELHAEAVSVRALARRFGTPLYVYSAATLRRHYRVLAEAFAGQDTLICYSVKALSNLSVLALLREQGAGFDIVSEGELLRTQAIDAHPDRTVFSGVGKTRDAMAAALTAGILSFNVESGEELRALEAVASELNRPAPISVRINPDVDAGTHPYISTGLKSNKFGVPAGEALALYSYAHASRHLEVIGVDCHIGSQLTDVSPVGAALDGVLEIVAELRCRGMTVQMVDLGGGLGIPYTDEAPASPADYANLVRARLVGANLRLVLEPGRLIAGNAGILVTEVLYRKVNGDKRFVITDAGMNDLIRPSLYGARHTIIPVQERPEALRARYDIVGPICETGDFLARDHDGPWPERGDLLAILGAGAYGFVMASNYNSHPRPAEVLVDGAAVALVRKREELAALFQYPHGRHNKVGIIRHAHGHADHFHVRFACDPLDELCRER